MYNEEKLTKLRALKQLAERIDRDFADKASMAALAGRVDSAAAVISSIERAMYQAPAPARFWGGLAGGLEQSAQTLLEARRNTLALAAGKLDALSPLKVLARGYAVVLHKGKAVRDLDALPAGEEVTLRAEKGKRQARLV